MQASRTVSPFEARAGAGRRPGALLFLLLLCACVSHPATLPPRSYLDERTGVSVSVVARPLIFARERSDLAASSRDYVTLVAVVLNNAGHYQHVLLGYPWSTVDARMDRERSDDPGTLVITADDRRIVLTPEERSLHDIGLDSAVGRPSGSHRPGRAYLTDPATLRFLAAARALRLQVGTQESAMPYQIWQDGRAALAGLVQPPTPRRR
jgi:hypothetical protein